MTITMPTEAEIVATRVQAGMSPAAASSPPAPSQATTAELIRERALEDAAELDAFVEMVAAHFRCQSLAADEVRCRLRPVFEELRGMAHRLRAEAERRRAPMPVADHDTHDQDLADRIERCVARASGRDVNGRFSGRR